MISTHSAEDEETRILESAVDEQEVCDISTLLVKLKIWPIFVSIPNNNQFLILFSQIEAGLPDELRALVTTSAAQIRSLQP